MALPRILRGPDDRESPDEEANIVAMSINLRETVENCDYRLVKSARRSVSYEDDTKYADLVIERGVQDRILDERLRANPVLRPDGWEPGA